MTLASLAMPIAIMPQMQGAASTSAGGGSGSDSTFQFNAAADKLAFVFQASSTTPPDQIKFRAATYTGTGTIDVTIETLDNTTGFPSGTPVTNSATGSVSVASTGTKTATGLAGTAVLTAGASYAIVLTATGGFAGDFTVLRATGTTGGMGMPYALTKDSAGAWTKSPSNNFGFALGFFDSGGVAIHMPGFFGAYSKSAPAFADSTNPDERGNRFSLPFPCTIYGVALYVVTAGTPSNTHSFTAYLYSGHTSGTPTELASQAHDGDEHADKAHVWVRFATPVDLAANTTYAISIKATSTTGPAMVLHSYASAAETAGYVDSNFYSTTRNNAAGAFTDLNTAAYAIYPIVSALDDGAGGAAGGLIRHPGMNGGLNG